MTDVSVNEAERVQVKIFVDGESPDATELIPVFHRWIRDAVIDDELIIDVADYSHVHHGPGVVLIGHQSDLYFDLGEGRPGLLYSLKRELGGDSLAGRLALAFARVLRAAELLEKEEGITLRFKRDEALVRVPDRLHAPNDDASYDALAPTLEATAKEALGKDVTLQREGAGTKSALSATVRA